MIRRINISLFFIFTVCTSLLKAQTGREWIVSGQPYYKIPVTQEAVYMIPFSQLNSSGISTLDPSKLQIWFRGVEQSIYINNNNLYFYGHGNDGALDSLIYFPTAQRTNKYYSLFSDTTYYFLTVGAVNGKRLNANSALPGVIENSHMHTQILSYADDYEAGQLYSSDTHLSPGDVGEGWMSNSVSQSGVTPKDWTISVPVSNLYSGGADPTLEIFIVGTNNNTHNIDIVIGNPSSPSQVYSIPYFYARSTYKFTQTIPLAYLTNNQPLKVTIRVKGNTIDPDMVSVGYLNLTYPQTTDVSGQSLYVLNPLADNNAKTLNVTGFTNNAFLWDISTEGAFVNLDYTFTSGTATVNVSSAASKILYANSFSTIIGMNQVDMSPYPTGNAEMLLITHAKLLAGDGIQNFINHRSSMLGGNVTISVADVTKLYDLYSYGEKHCIAISRYCQEQIDAGTPKYLFLIGKGIDYDYYGTTDNGDYYYRKNPAGFINNHHSYQDLNYRMEDLIPAYGWPASDLYYTITDGTLRPKLATGRLSARTNDDVNQYVDKLIANDKLTSDVIWRKNLVHLSGGKTSDEVQSFLNVVNGFKAIVEGPLFGGKVVRTYSKSLSVGAVDTKLIYSIADAVNAGISYLTFFGHSSPSIIDLDIGDVSNPVYGYNNAGKYPVLIQNGCQSAAFFIMGCIPENWIMTPKKGALLTLGHGDIGYPSYMQTYTNYFYKLNFTDSKYINSSIGDIHKKTIDTFLTYYASDFSNPQIVAAQATQYVLQGDPTAKMYKPQLTDYAIAGDAEAGEKKVFIHAYGSAPISATSDSFAVAIPITNYGLSNSKNLQIQIKHTVTNNNVVVIDETFPIKTIGPIGYVDTIYITVVGNNPKLFGINQFTITVDPFDSIPEFNEHNNVATLQLFVPLSSVSCLYPLEYSVVHDQPVSFIAQSIDLFQAETNYYVEIDTSHYFNSPAKITKTIASGPLVKFSQTLLTDVLPSDSIVYYWRIRFQDVAGQDTLWGTSSFIYIKDSPDGWSQSQYPQFFKDTYSHITISSHGALDFVRDTSILYARTQANDVNNQEIGFNNNTLLSFIPGGPNCSYADGALVVVFDAESALPYLVDPSYQCGVYMNPQVQRFFDLTNPGNQNALASFLTSNKIKPNDFVLFMSTGRTGADVWSSTLKDVFLNHGAQQIGNLGAYTPYIFLYRNKPGATAPLQEIYSADSTQQIQLNYNLIGQYKSGYITSTLIGPSSLWGTMYHTVQIKANDVAVIKVIRINSQGKNIDTIAVPQTGNVDLNPLIDAAAFPYIRLLMYAQDTTDFTPAYLKKWQVIYSPVPEGTIDVSTVGASKYTVTDKNIGQSFTLPYAFENISNVDFPIPLRVVFTLRNDRGGLKHDTITIGLLPKGQTTQFNYTVNIGNSVGKNVLQAYVNPRLQREVYYQNNVLETSFNVQQDVTHPVIGAMFDGVHIFDGDIVSPQPVITATLTDNNQLLTLGDSTMSVVIIYPDQSSHTIFKTSPGVMLWGPDPQKQGKFTVEYKPPVDFADGKYKLIIQGKDASGNRSGNQNLEVNFQVVNASTLTNFYPYPNPFSTSTRFVFTLTGKDIPEDIKIEIMTVSGKIVKEIFKGELGNIHAGDNITDYAWDGRDQYGDKLANGVYIYRVVLKNAGNDFQHRDTAGDQAFKKGYGKMYILR